LTDRRPLGRLPSARPAHRSRSTRRAVGGGRSWSGIASEQPSGCSRSWRDVESRPSPPGAEQRLRFSPNTDSRLSTRPGRNGRATRARVETALSTVQPRAPQASASTSVRTRVLAMSVLTAAPAMSPAPGVGDASKHTPQVMASYAFRRSGGSRDESLGPSTLCLLLVCLPRSPCPELPILRQR
jgi:hypothetical protein